MCKMVGYGGSRGVLGEEGGRRYGWGGARSDFRCGWGGGGEKGLITYWWTRGGTGWDFEKIAPLGAGATGWHFFIMSILSAGHRYLGVMEYPN
jgi:hypothetical protein